MALPGGARHGHRGDGVAGVVGNPFLCYRVGVVLARNRQRLADHWAQFVLTAEDFDGLRTPPLALLCKRAGLMFGLAGFQGGLLCQCDRFDVGGLTSVVCLELLGQLAGAGFDGLAARGPACVEFGVDTDDFADRALTPTGWCYLGELQSEALAKMCVLFG